MTVSDVLADLAAPDLPAAKPQDQGLWTRCVEAVRGNLANTHLAEQATVVCGAVERLWDRLRGDHGEFDIVFADPPYEHRPWGEFLRALLTGWNGVAQDGVVVVQCRAGSGPGAAPAGGPTRVKALGDTEMRFYESSQPDGP